MTASSSLEREWIRVTYVSLAPWEGNEMLDHITMFRTCLNVFLQTIWIWWHVCRHPIYMLRCFVWHYRTAQDNGLNMKLHLPQTSGSKRTHPCSIRNWRSILFPSQGTGVTYITVRCLEQLWGDQISTKKVFYDKLLTYKSNNRGSGSFLKVN